MDALNELLINYGYIGILIASFLAASILPFSSEVAKKHANCRTSLRM